MRLLAEMWRLLRTACGLLYVLLGETVMEEWGRQARWGVYETAGGRVPMTVTRAGEVASGCAGAGCDGANRCPWGPAEYG